MSPMWERLSSLASVLLHRQLLRFAVVLVAVLESGDQAEAAEGDLVRARVVDGVVRDARAIGQVGEPGSGRAEAVGDPRAGRTRDDVARSDRPLLVLDADPGALR